MVTYGKKFLFGLLDRACFKFAFLIFPFLQLFEEKKKKDEERKKVYCVLYTGDSGRFAVRFGDSLGDSQVKIYRK